DRGRQNARGTRLCLPHPDSTGDHGGQTARRQPGGQSPLGAALDLCAGSRLPELARLAEIIEAGAHFVVRFKDRINYQIFLRLPLPPTTADRGFSLTSDWAVCLPGWGDAILRLVSYRLPDGRLVRVL